MSNRVEQMAEVLVAIEGAQLKFNCGCAFKTRNIVEADKHVWETKHTMTVLGLVTPRNGGGKHANKAGDLREDSGPSGSAG
jgi:hypothetical protein